MSSTSEKIDVLGEKIQAAKNSQAHDSLKLEGKSLLQVVATVFEKSNLEDYPVASQAEAEQGVATDRYMTPLSVGQAIKKALGGDAGGLQNVDAARLQGSTLNEVLAAARAGNADSATKLATARVIEVKGDLTGKVNFDGTKDVAITGTLADTGVTAGEFPVVSVDSKGRVLTGRVLKAADIPQLPVEKLPFAPIQQGGRTTMGTNKVYIGLAKDAGGGLLVSVDSTDYGNVWPIDITGGAQKLGGSSLTEVVDAARNGLATNTDLNTLVQQLTDMFNQAASNISSDAQST